MKKLISIDSIIIRESNICTVTWSWFRSRCKTAIVITDPQNDFLSPEGATWGVESVMRNNTVENLDQLLKQLKKKNTLFCISTLLFQTWSQLANWGFIKALMHKINMFDRTGVLP
jgi:hypothetical protein